MPEDNLVARLKAQFDADPELKEKCIVSCKSAINDNKANRVFDDFPPLVSINDCASLIEEYQQLLVAGSKYKVRALQKRLIKMACDELFDVNGNIKQELIELLELQEVVSGIDNYQAATAFVGMMNIYMSSTSAACLQANQYNYLAMTRIINNSYGEWIREYMRDNNIQYNSRYDDNSFKVENLHPLFFVSMFVGGLAGVGIYGAVKLGQTLYNEHKPLSLPEAPKL